MKAVHRKKRRENGEVQIILLSVWIYMKNSTVSMIRAIRQHERFQTKMTPVFALKQRKRRGFGVNDQSGRIIVT